MSRPRRSAALVPLAAATCLLGAAFARADVPDSAGEGGSASGFSAEALAEAEERARALSRLRSLIVAHRGREVLALQLRGPDLDTPVNIKSASKSVLSALVGIAIEQGHLEGVDQRVAPFFERYLRGDVDPRKRRITIGNLLSMRSGLERTSGQNYGAFVRSRNWARHVITRPMVEAPGTRMRYSTGNTHLLSAILTRATGRSTLDYARDELMEPLGVRLPAWRRDPQGIYFGGNQMLLSPRGMLRFGELYRHGGTWEGQQIVPRDWVEASTRPRGRSIFSGEMYGYGWFVSRIGGHRAFYAWGYGGQHIVVVPARATTIVTTSVPHGPRDFDHLRAIRGLVEDLVAAPGG